MAYVVVAIHTNPFYGITSEPILKIWDIIANMAVPYFFLASGFLLGIKLYPETIQNNRPGSNILKNYLKKNCVMYVLWSAIYLPLAINHYMAIGVSFDIGIRNYIEGFLFRGKHYNSWQLWYLLSTIYAGILIFIIVSIKKLKLKTTLITAICTSILNIILDQLCSYSGTIPKNVFTLHKIVKYCFEGGGMLKGSVYILLGISLAIMSNTLKYNYTFIVLGLLGGAFSYSNSIMRYFSTMCISVGLFDITRSLELKDSYVYLIFRKMSRVIFFIHMWVWSFWYTIVFGQKTFGLEAFIVTSVISSILAYIYCIAGLKYKHIY